MNGNEIIRVSGLKKYYKGDKIKALDGVDAVINHGEVVVVIDGEIYTAVSDACAVSIAKATINLNEYAWQAGEFIYDGEEKSVYLADASGNVLTFGATYSGNKNTEVGEIYTVHITESDVYDLYGELVEE